MISRMFRRDGSDNTKSTAANLTTTSCNQAEKSEKASPGIGGSPVELSSTTPTPPPLNLPPRCDNDFPLRVHIPHYRVRNTYVEYCIACYQAGLSWCVYRRYQQFKTLDRALQQLCDRKTRHHDEYGALPVLPGSRWLGATNHSRALVDRRRRYLEIYLQQLLVPQNGFRGSAEHLHAFLHEGEVPLVPSLVPVEPLQGLMCSWPGRHEENTTQFCKAPSIPRSSEARFVVVSPSVPQSSVAREPVEMVKTSSSEAAPPLSSRSGVSSLHDSSSGASSASLENETHQRVEMDASCCASEHFADKVSKAAPRCTECASGPYALCGFAAPTADSPARTSSFQLITVVGRGASGRVMKVRMRSSGHLYAMKVLSKSTMYSRRMLAHIEEEHQILNLLPPHPYLVRYHYAFQTAHHLFFVFDFLPGGELYRRIYPSLCITPEMARLYAAELVLALGHIHEHGVVHRDLKPENIILCADGHVHLTDFGLARRMQRSCGGQSFVGSAEYLSPEVIRGEQQTVAVDWWSLGVLLYEMLAGTSPFHGDTNDAVYTKVITKELDFHASCFTPNAAALLRKLLERSQDKRLQSVEEVKAHPYFEGIVWDALLRKEISTPIVPQIEENDTRYFPRPCTAEWAHLPDWVPLERDAAESVARCLSGVPFVQEVEEVAGDVQNGFLFGAKTLRQHASEDPEWVRWRPPPKLPSDTSEVVGLWSLLSVASHATDGRIAYPWGGEVMGQLWFHPSGCYSMQLTSSAFRPVPRSCVQRATLEELNNVLNGYLASFGEYQWDVGSNCLQLNVVGGTCYADEDKTKTLKLVVEVPRLSRVLDSVAAGEHSVNKRRRLRLLTAPCAVPGKLFAVTTVLTWALIADVKL